MTDTDPTPDEDRAAAVSEGEQAHAQAMQDARTLLDAGMVAELVTETHRLAVSVDNLATNLVDNNARLDELLDLRRRNRRLTAVIVVGAGIITVVVATLLIVVLVLVGRLSDVNDTQARTGRIIAECTSPSPPAGEALDEEDGVHECYEDGIRRQRANVGALNSAALDAAVCAITNAQASDPEDAIPACFDARRPTPTTVP